MTSLLTAVLVAVAPFAGVSLLLWLAGRRQRERETVVARQIGLTDAIHRELGALAAPTVTRRGGAWRVTMAVPLERPHTVAALVRLTARAAAGWGPVEILLTADARPAARSELNRRPAPAGVPAAA
jgi:hypothetical protein